MEDSPIRAKRLSLRSTVAPVMIAFVLGGLLLMLWPGLLALFFGILLMIQSCIAEQEISTLSGAGISLWSNRPRLSPRIRPFLSAYLR